MAKFYKYFFFLLVFLILLTLITLSFNSNLRRTSLNYMISGYKLYMFISIQSDLKKQNLNLTSAEKKISNYLTNSKKIANGKSSLLIGIYDVLNLVETSIINDNDFSIFEDVLLQIIKIDPSLYNARLLYAKSLLANKKIDEAKNQILVALELNPLDHEAYRTLIKIDNTYSGKNNYEELCVNYKNSDLGGSKARYKNTIFSGFNLNKFSLNFNEKRNGKQNLDLYTVSGITLNNFSSYEIIPNKRLDFNAFNLYFNFPPGTILEIKGIKLYSKLKKFDIEEKETFITSKNSFFINNQNSTKIIFTKLDNEIINIKFNEVYKDIEKIELIMNISKTELTNKICEQKSK